jgi:outer membrane immunogenic protein
MNFKASIFGACASVIALSAASAADLPSRKAPVALRHRLFHGRDGMAGVSRGGYAGGDANYNVNLYSVTGDCPGAAWKAQPIRSGTSGFTVGYEAGYSWQLSNNVVVGYEFGLRIYVTFTTNGTKTY